MDSPFAYFGIASTIPDPINLKPEVVEVAEMNSNTMSMIIKTDKHEGRGVTSSLVAVNEATVGGDSIQTVNARELHAFLESKQRFSDWIKARIDKYEFTQDVDFVAIHNPMTSPPSVEYHISLDMAKELSMVERNEKGKAARKYFIEIEKAYRNQQPKELTREQILVMALESERERVRLSAQIEVMTPKAEYYDLLMGSEELMDGEQAAKFLRTSRQKLFAFLKERGVLTKSNLPMQLYIDKDFMRIKPTLYTDFFGNPKTSLKVVFTQRVIQYIRVMFDDFINTRDLVIA